MPRLSEMPRPGPLTGLELLPALQGAGPGGNVGLPILVSGSPFGGAVPVLRAPMTADLSATTDADPGAGGIRWNNADPDLSTVLYISDDDDDAEDLATVLSGLGVGGFIYLQGAAAFADEPSARDNLQKWQVTSIADATGYTKVGVSLQASAGSFADDDVLELTIQQPLPSPGVDRNVVSVITSVSGVATIDASLGDYFVLTLTEDTTLAVVNSPVGCSLHIAVARGAAPYTLSVPGSWNFGQGVTPPSMPTGAGSVLDYMITTNNSGGAWIATARIRA